MYAFQEVHTYNSSPCGSSTSRVDVIQEETGLRTRYYGKTPPPLNHVYPWVFEDFFERSHQERIQMFVNGKQLPPMKENFPTAAMITYDDFSKARDALVAANVPNPYITYINPMPITFGDCTSAPTPGFPAKTLSSYGEAWNLKQEQGNNPMRDYDYACKTSANVATATVIQAASTEVSDQRAYLLRRFEELTRYEWNDSKTQAMSEMFNLGAPKFPKTSQELLDAFKNGKFTVDQKKVDANTAYYADHSEDEDFDDNCMSGSWAQFFGVTFTDLPVADRKGYDAAMAAYRKLKQDTKDAIMIGTPAEGLAALKAFELWMPTQTAPTTTTVQ